MTACMGDVARINKEVESEEMRRREEEERGVEDREQVERKGLRTEKKGKLVRGAAT